MPLFPQNCSTCDALLQAGPQVEQARELARKAGYPHGEVAYCRLLDLAIDAQLTRRECSCWRLRQSLFFRKEEQKKPCTSCEFFRDGDCKKATPSIPILVPTQYTCGDWTER